MQHRKKISETFQPMLWQHDLLIIIAALILYKGLDQLAASGPWYCLTKGDRLATQQRPPVNVVKVDF